MRWLFLTLISFNVSAAEYSKSEREVISRCSQKSEIWVAEKCMQRGGIEVARLNGEIGAQICLMRNTYKKVALCEERYGLEKSNGGQK